MALSITPAVDKWLSQTDAFTIIFKAFDDNGIQCRNKEMAIKYNITYDGTMPDLTQLQETYGDASGIIALVITKPCVISLFGIHAHDVKDSSKGSVTQEIVINYEITFKPVVNKIAASYNGGDIQVTDDLDVSKILITAEYNNGTTNIIPIEHCVVLDKTVYNIGENIKTLTYTDPDTGFVWNVEFTVNGVPKLLSLETEYIGPVHQLGDKVFQEEIIVYGVFLISQTDTERLEISRDKWYFIDIPIITQDNNGILNIRYQKSEVKISIPYNIIRTLRLKIWYEGAKIKVGNLFNPEDLIIYLVHPDGRTERMPWHKCHIDSFFITKEGYNWFTATYITGFLKITQMFFVEGIIPKNYIDLDFKVLYIQDKTSDREEDQLNLTKEFEKEMLTDGILMVEWKQFLKVVNNLNKYGMYIVTVPKLSGLSDRFDMDWSVLCINKNTIKATIKKVYNEEE